MTQDEIMELARQAGYQHPDAVGQCEDFAYFDLEAFAKLVAEKEREACALICENYGDEAFVDGRINADHHAYLIRARGQA